MAPHLFESFSNAFVQPRQKHAVRKPLAKIRGGALRVVGLCGMPDGTRILRAEVTGPISDAEDLGVRLADDLLSQGADKILAATKD